jgi:hypothetical protein
MKKKESKPPEQELRRRRLRAVEEKNLALAVGSSGYSLTSGDETPPPDPLG